MISTKLLNKQRLKFKTYKNLQRRELKKYKVYFRTASRKQI
jgi:hypothetical protein